MNKPTKNIENKNMNNYSNNNNFLNYQQLNNQLPNYDPNYVLQKQMNDLYLLNLINNINNNMNNNMSFNVFGQNNNNNNFKNINNFSNSNNLDINKLYKLKTEIISTLINDEKCLQNKENINNYIYNFLNFDFNNSSVDYQNTINQNLNIDLNDNLNQNDNNKTEINKKNLINIQDILNGVEKRTVVKLSPIPLNYSSIEASKLIDKYLKIEYSKKHRIYNGIYVPLSETINKNLEYCLVNLIKPEYVIIFYKVFNGLWINKKKIIKCCSVVFSDQQENFFGNKEDPAESPLVFNDTENAEEYAKEFFESKK